MNKNDYKAMVRSMFSGTDTALKSTLERMSLIDVGIIKNIPAAGLADVVMAASVSKTYVRVLRCVLLSPASKALSVSMKPNVGDRVLVLTPHVYAKGMFDPENEDTVVNANAPCNAPSHGLALLLNQIQPEKYDNRIDVLPDGSLEGTLMYDADNDNSLMSFSGDITDNTFDLTLYRKGQEHKENLSLSLAADGALSLTLADGKLKVVTDTDGRLKVSNDKASIEMSKDGQVTVTGASDKNMTLSANGCTVELKSDSVSINGKLTVKK